jgi:hypothetical protein
MKVKLEIMMIIMTRTRKSRGSENYDIYIASRGTFISADAHRVLFPQNSAVTRTVNDTN